MEVRISPRCQDASHLSGARLPVMRTGTVKTAFPAARDTHEGIMSSVSGKQKKTVQLLLCSPTCYGILYVSAAHTDACPLLPYSSIAQWLARFKEIRAGVYISIASICAQVAFINERRGPRSTGSSEVSSAAQIQVLFGTPTAHTCIEIWSVAYYISQSVSVVCIRVCTVANSCPFLVAFACTWRLFVPNLPKLFDYVWVCALRLAAYPEH